MFELSKAGQEVVRRELSRYETKRSAILPALYAVQKEKGWIPPEAVTYLSQFMELPEAWINEVLHFYTMYNKKPVGKYHVQVCANISCAMNGGRELADHLCQKFNVDYEEVTSDGRYTISRVECLGACDGAPMMQVNDDFHENLTPEKAVQLLEKMK